MKIIHIKEDHKTVGSKKVNFEMRKEAFKSDFISKHNKKFKTNRNVAS